MHGRKYTRNTLVWKTETRTRSNQAVERGIRNNGIAAIGNHAWEYWEHWEYWGQWNPMAANENGNF
jgi:hypothetical protein